MKKLSLFVYVVLSGQILETWLSFCSNCLISLNVIENIDKMELSCIQPTLTQNMETRGCSIEKNVNAVFCGKELRSKEMHGSTYFLIICPLQTEQASSRPIRRLQLQPRNLTRRGIACCFSMAKSKSFQRRLHFFVYLSRGQQSLNHLLPFISCQLSDRLGRAGDKFLYAYKQYSYMA